MKENILSYPFTIFHVQEQRPLIGMHESHVRFGWITSETLTLNESETYQSYSFVWVLNIFRMFAYAVDMLDGAFEDADEDDEIRFFGWVGSGVW